jgi:hypothetical protein
MRRDHGRPSVGATLDGDVYAEFILTVGLKLDGRLRTVLNSLGIDPHVEPGKGRVRRGA